MTEITRKEPGVAELPAFPTLANVVRSLLWLRRELPLEPSRILDCYDLLCLPCLEDGTDMVTKASRLTNLLKQAIELVPDPLHRLILDEMLLSGAQGSSISTRLRSARTKAVDSNLLVAKTSEKTVGEIESHAITSLARVLLSATFTQPPVQSANGTPARRRTPVASLPGLVKRHYCWSLEFDPSDTHRAVGYKAVTVEATQEPQCVFLDRFYTTGSAPKPESLEPLAETEKHEWLETRPEHRPDSPPASWWYHIFNLGDLIEAGEIRTLRWREVFLDKGETLRPHLAMIATVGQESLSVAMRLPSRHQARTAEARITADPLGKRNVKDNWELSPDTTGWCMARFKDLEPGVEYGIYFTNLQLYS